MDLLHLISIPFRHIAIHMDMVLRIDRTDSLVIRLFIGSHDRRVSCRPGHDMLILILFL